MPNLVLDRLLSDRQSQIDFVDQLLSRVDEDGRDLVDAERANLESARTRIAELDAQIEPLEGFESIRSTHAEATRVLGRAPEGTETRRLGAGGREVTYRSPGSFLVDLLRASGYLNARSRDDVRPDTEAAGRIARAVANQTTVETPGLLPEPIVGGVVNLMDASRPFVTSIGAKSMGGIPGKTFSRPKITTHVQVGMQASEKTQLPSRAMQIDDVPFTKATFGGTVNVSRQDIDWTSPAAWDILVRDLADVYAIETENAAADDFVTKADDHNAATVVASNDLAGWSEALYTAAALVYGAYKKLPDRIWCSVDVWASLGPIVDQGRMVFSNATSDSSLTSFSGVVLDVPRIVVPSFAPGTCVIGSSAAYEFYEETIGLLSAVEPSILGVEVAYGGYVAYNAVASEGLALVTPPAGPLTARSAKTNGK